MFKAAHIGAMVLALAAGGVAVAQVDYGNFQDIVTSGLNTPVGLVACPGDDSRLFVVEQGGRIRIINVSTDGLGNKSYALAATPFLDLAALDAASAYFRDGSNNPLQDQTGTVIPRLIRNGGNPVVSGGNNYAVQRGGEQGLLSLVFAPDFATSRKFYIYYCMSNPAANGTLPFSLSGNGTANNPFRASLSGNNVVFEFQASASNPNVVDPASEKMVISIPDDFTNHNGAQMFFGSDGMLYIGTGDGGSGNDPNNRALNPNSLLGKMLRIDVAADDYPADATRNYAIPDGLAPYTQIAANPFATAGGRPEIWARGLRNPWRWSFDRWNGDMWIGDVGQGLWEEVNRVPGAGSPGLNYGWRVREGLANTGLTTGGFDVSSLTAPVYVYPHASNQAGTGGAWTANQDGVSIVGGVVYRGNAIRGWRGTYFFADTYSTQLWGISATAPSGTAGTPAAVGGVLDYSGVLRSTVSGVTPPAIANIVSINEDNDGEIFVVQIGGRIRKIVPQNAQLALADIGSQGGLAGPDGQYDNNDFVVFIDWFFGGNPGADIGKQGGLRGVDQRLDNNDFIVFIDAFFEQE